MDMIRAVPSSSTSQVPFCWRLVLAATLLLSALAPRSEAAMAPAQEPSQAPSQAEPQDAAPAAPQGKPSELQTDAEFLATEAEEAAAIAAARQAAGEEPVAAPTSAGHDLAAVLTEALARSAGGTGTMVVVDGEPAVLRVWHRPIAVFRATYQGVAPAERTRLAAERIEDLPDEFLTLPVTPMYLEVEGTRGALFMIRERMLFGLLEQDVNALAGETLEQAVEAARERLEAVLADQREQLSVANLIRGGVVALIATLLFAAIVFFGVRLQDRVIRVVEKQVLPKLPSPFGLDLRAGILAIEESLVRIASWVLVAIGTYLWLTIVLQQFPYSRPWGAELGNFIADILQDLGAGAVGAMPGLFTVAVILLATRMLVRALDAFFVSIERGRMRVGWLPAETARATRRIVTVLTWLFAITVAYPYMPGSGSTAFKGVSVFAGVMLSFGSVGFVNQVMSGLVLVYSRALRIGDVVTINEVSGIVSEVGILSTKLRTARREEVTIPNAVVATTNVVNYTRLAGADGAIVATRVSIGYDTPWRQVHALLIMAAERTPRVNTDPPPVVVQISLADFYVEYELRVRVERPLDRFAVLSDLHANIQDAFNEHGVQIMSPHFEQQPGQPVVVPPHAFHAAPAVRPPDAPT
jgi:small-conductance mechanosensitive channel